ncbi:CaiB/BaiF CoA transferase family protein [Bacillus smithii]|jgi:crotonobetainyl-CoA:carnitine CoA-transferase CaiB-like acyl-CoA transferase|uniref:CaiB/BaiF CoA transferase family protein n=1 Tax=Bacillus smithii TaxID=1479 RepID=UPI00065E7FCF|nr:CaiB/BaiF CoA-transferase family protein [Bacillus smithii]AKP46511.1 Alpha-methylacyl-CoA racemase [Bacillus smithii]MED4884662.1 CaiB/BaiF CoA-transferase family protein [Bacillus smithii]MED4928324.1 CaiB/BaiF CoA-transferase family protein [Bacillus smithii]
MTLLHDLKILDFSSLLPGPYASMMLADLGADVLRVESPTRHDLIRQFPPMDGEQSTSHSYLNRSKRSIALDLKKQEAVEIVKRLVKEYDIIIEQFRPGVMDRLGVGYEALKKINPRIIYCSITGFGQSGPYKDRPGHDNNYLSLSGVADGMRRNGEKPIASGIQVADVAGGSLHAVIAILAAVYYREKTGEGQWLDISMTAAAFALNAIYGSGVLAGGVEIKPESMLLNGGTFYDYYETKDGRYFSVGSLEPPFRKALCEGIGRPDLIHLAMSENLEDIHVFKEEVQKTFQQKTFNEWCDIFYDFQACVEPVLTFSEASEHPQLKAREMIVEVPKKDGTTQKQIACPIKFSAGKAQYKHVGSLLGEHTEEVLEELGYTREEVLKLKDKGIFG